jgi:Domain of unknown function (DUF4268)
LKTNWSEPTIHSGDDPSQEANAGAVVDLRCKSQRIFGLLKSQKDAIERELSYPLDWEELPEAQECRVSSCLNDADPEDQADWPRQHQWLVKRMDDLHRAFSQRVRALE